MSTTLPGHPCRTEGRNQLQCEGGLTGGVEAPQGAHLLHLPLGVLGPADQLAALGHGRRFGLALQLQVAELVRLRPGITEPCQEAAQARCRGRPRSSAHERGQVPSWRSAPDTCMMRRG